MSLDDLRDQYKTLRQSNDVKLKLNGATYRKIRNLEMKKAGNTIVRKETGKTGENPEIDYLNEKYNLKNKNQEYSLNKNKRWELAGDLIQNMNEFKIDDTDVRLFETRNRLMQRGNLIAIHKSKGDKLSVKHTYANLDSIRRKEFLDRVEKKNPKEKIVKVNRFKDKTKSKSNLNEPKHIIIKDYDDDEDGGEEADGSSGHFEYLVDHAPTKDFLKYSKIEAKPFNKQVAFKSYLSVSDDESLRRDLNETESDEEINSDIDDDYLVIDELDKNKIEVSLHDLINKYADNLLEKQKLAENNRLLKKDTIDKDLEPKNKIFYVEKIKRETPLKKSILKYSESIPIKLELTKDSLNQDTLKQTYNLKYNEAINCWPRYFNINLDDDVKKVINRTNVSLNFDLVVWLRFQEIIDIDNEENNSLNETSFYNVTILTNLQSESIYIENINPCHIWSLSGVVDRTIQFLTSLPVSLFRVKENIQKSSLKAKKDELDIELPNIGGNAEVTNIEELKFKLIEKTAKASNDSVTPKVNLNRLNSIEVTKKENIEDNEKLKIDQSIQKIFAENMFECILCFDEVKGLNNCTILKNCGHVFCNDCIRDYVDSRISNPILNAGKFPCASCDNEIELALIINFASNCNLLDIYIRTTVERISFLLSNYKWCPSPNCCNILKVDLVSNPYGTVSCKCGFKMCLKCNNTPHFPAKCSQIANYYEELKSSKLILPVNDEITTSRGKYCPKCQTFIEKNDGCNQMFCVVCKEYFCWNCEKIWSEHLKLTNGNHSCVINDTSRGLIKVEFVARKKKSKAENKLSKYEESMHHRQMRTAKAKKERATMAKRLLETIKFDDLGAEDGNDKFNFIKDMKFKTDKYNEIKHFLEEIVEFLSELHFVCEYAYILLRDKDISRENRNFISHVVKSLELVIWRIKLSIEIGRGVETIEKLKTLHKYGLKTLKMLKNINQ